MKKKWTLQEARDIFNLPLLTLLLKAQTKHRECFESNLIQVSSLLSIKTGGCSEDCAYCSQSSRHKTGLKKEPLMALQDVITAAKKAKDSGATRLCMGAAWRGPNDEDLEIVCKMIAEVKKLNLEACVTLGFLSEMQVKKLKEAGLDYYNHNIDTSPDFYNQIVTTHTFEDRLKTLDIVRKAGIKICCGGILGMGETNDDRIKMLVLLASLEKAPDSIPINKLIKHIGTPLVSAEGGTEENKLYVDPFDLVRTIALARIMMPESYVRLSAGREQMSDELQALCFMAGANSVFYGEKLLTADNAAPARDELLFKRLGLKK